MNKIFFAATLFFILLSACSHKLTVKPLTHTEYEESLETAEHKRQILVGKWLGEQSTENGQSSRWLMNRKSNASYKVTFQSFLFGKKIDEISEEGIWGISGPVYFTVSQMLTDKGKTTSNDPRDPRYYDAYEILSLDEHAFTYQHFGNHKTFTVKKVNDRFELN